MGEACWCDAGEETGRDGGHAGDDSGVEATGAWEGMEEVSQRWEFRIVYADLSW